MLEGVGLAVLHSPPGSMRDCASRPLVRLVRAHSEQEQRHREPRPANASLHPHRKLVCLVKKVQTCKHLELYKEQLESAACGEQLTL